MTVGTAQRSFAGFIVICGLVVGMHAGCDSDGGPGGGNGISSAACSSCQEAYTADVCKEWGSRAGCEESGVASEGSCDPTLAGCDFTSCKGVPICNDEGSAECASCDGDLSQADCDAIGEAAGCETVMTSMFNACGKDVTGCTFLGCDFMPECE